MRIIRDHDGVVLGCADNGKDLEELLREMPGDVKYTVTHRDNEERRSIIHKKLGGDLWSIAGSIQCMLALALRWLVIIIKHLPAARAEIETNSDDARILAELLSEPDWSDRANPGGTSDAIHLMNTAAQVLRDHPKE
ncbi:MAG: hypothetical protein QNK37_38240 [Acidobacteriota bacterium]|nr:hypothetical protein [Acidobacteriota bacterium]